MKISDLSIIESFKDKTILIIGGSGFIGKVWFSMLLDHIPKMNKIYILIRPENGKGALQRFTEIYSKSPAFVKLHQKYGSNFSEIKNVEILSGNVSLPDLGLKSECIKNLQNSIDLIVNFAADLRFIAPLDQVLQTNTCGPLNIANFILQSKKAKLLQISTCYVAGGADGVVSERISKNTSPNGTYFKAEDELKWSMQECEAARARNATDKEIKHLGTIRAERLGWPNTYTYSKALGEILLSEKLSKEKLCIFRPSIVESAEKYPFPGWNEDFNGTAPFIQMLSTRYRFLVAKPHHNLDIIPVDYVAKGLTIAACALMENKHSLVYQSSTSSINPLSVKLATDYIFHYYKSQERKTLEGYLLPSSKPKFITPKHLLSGQSLHSFEKSVGYIVGKIKHNRNSSKLLNNLGIEKTIEKIRRKAKTIDTLMKIYKPFIYDYNYTFKSENLKSHHITENEFNYSPEEIKWDQYWKKVHIPGLNRWCMPELKKFYSTQKKELP